MYPLTTSKLINNKLGLVISYDFEYAIQLLTFKYSKESPINLPIILKLLIT